MRQRTSFEVLHDAALGIGFLFIGLSPSLWDRQPYGYLTVVAGLILVLVAVIGKRIWR